MAWATALSPLLSRQPHSGLTLDFSRFPLVVNAYYLGSLLVFYALIAPFIYILNKQYNEFFTLYSTIDAALGEASRALQMGMLSDVSSLGAMKTQLLGMSEGIYESFRTVWIIYSVSSTVLFIVSTCPTDSENRADGTSRLSRSLAYISISLWVLRFDL